MDDLILEKNLKETLNKKSEEIGGSLADQRIRTRVFEAIEEEKNMKLMIASDIHGSAYYCRKLLEAYKTEKAERLLLLGDILYHGPRNDLPKDYAPK